MTEGLSAALSLDALVARPADDHAASVAAFVELEWPRGRGSSPFARACVGGARAGTLERAFALGYLAAVAALTGDERRGALALTEAAGPRPGDVATTLLRTGPGALELTGEKSFVTLADVAEVVFVVAREPEPASGEAPLRLVRVPRGAPGARLEARAPLPFAPGVGHARLSLERVRVGEADVLPGDGWSRYGRPFRSLEDVHVLGAVVGHTLAHAPRAPHDARERALSVQLALEGVAQRLARELAVPARSAREAPLVCASTELALAGALHLAEGALDGLRPALEGGAREAFERDAPLLAVARGAREQRRARAWERASG